MVEPIRGSGAGRRESAGPPAAALTGVEVAAPVRSAPVRSAPVSSAPVSSAPPASAGPARCTRPDPPEEPRWQVLLNAGVWLIFLFWPVATIVTSEDALSTKAIAVLGLAAFVAVYLTAFLVPHPVPRLPRWANTALYSVVLLATLVPTSLAAGPTVAYTVPYFVALWLFSHSPRIGLIGAGAAATMGVVAAMAWSTGTDRFWFLLPLSFSIIIMGSIRYSMAKDEDAQRLREDLIRSQQRESVARDVHDVLGHTLTVVAVKAELARRLITADPERAGTELDDVLELTRSSLAEVRATVGGLRTPQLSAQVAAARIALDAAGIYPRLPGPSDADAVPAEHEEVFAWCLREAVTNVVRHSGARRCTVTLEPGLLTIVDDGHGPGEGNQAGTWAGSDGAENRWAAGAGTGIAGMRGRVADADGTLVVGPDRAGHDLPGMRVEVRL